MAWSKMSVTEIALAKKWYIEDGETTAEIAQRLGRDQSSITRLLVKRRPRKTQGRKKALSSAQIDKMEAKLEAMIAKADGKYEVTVDMLKRASHAKVSLRTILDALHARGVYFRPLRQKTTLTADDVTQRKAFADKFASKPRTWWMKAIHLHIDVKHFQVLPHGRARKHAAQETTRGKYRKRGQGLGEGHTKPVSNTKFNTGAPGVKVLACVGNGKVLVWEYLEGPWGGRAADRAYRGLIAKALRSEYPGRRSFTILEDNDPSGFKSSIARTAKQEEGIVVFEIPKRSPCLNVCDYFLWSAVNRRMREQERGFALSKRETRAAYLKRLRRAALSLPPDVLGAAVGDMKRRCLRLQEADGGNIEEGGK